jgi:hypothetical protein
VRIIKKQSDSEDCEGEVVVGHEAFVELHDGDEVAHPSRMI